MTTVPAPRVDQANLATTEAFRTIAELGGDLAFVFDCATGLPVYVSPGIDDMLGYSLDDVRAQMEQGGDGPLAALVAGLPERLRRFAAGDGSRLRVMREFDLLRPDGSEVAVEVISALSLDDGGQPRALLGLVRDVSARRERERERKRFASMLNHEFRTPLSTIDGAIQRLEALGTKADEATRQRYRNIATATDRLIAMLDDYLSPERMASLGSRRRENAVGPRLLLEELVAQTRVAGRPVTMTAGELPAALRGEPSGLRLALKVLLDNALRYTPAGTALHVTGRRVDGGVEMALRDEGPGVSLDDVARIFDKGYRGANATGVAGSGLGLYMARSVVEVHGGSLTYAPPAEGGAEFRLWLPVPASSAKGLASGMSNSDNRNGNRG
ncbi:PAS domain-containing sensor histidine kinase [Massilia pinisoli]|uniref:histidine kinase n=1 Tax=Massilia pinisoli TaxID=1772194 RepID=A0ABT1ZZ85_9BURK|nr:PAS domain-containing sensor histidine kinase [Massilia pinisoli]MCS0585240.1 PAS domain-containing sensor histidine kinase [Massilia pinisoli]